MTETALSVVVLAWDQLELTRRCVASVRSTTDVPYELVIVDNGSAAGAAAFAQSAADIAIMNPENLGFAVGMNQGLTAAQGNVVAFVNNDTVLPQGWASLLLETFAEHPEAGLVLPAVTSAGNPYSVRTAPGTDRIVVPPFREIPSGVVYLLRRAYALEIGGWSEEYPVASSEDLDLLFTVWSTGREVVLDERVLVDHVGSATVAEKLTNRHELWRDNRHAFTAKWMAMTSAAIPRPAGTDEALVAARAREAATAATWMERTFLAREETRGANRTVPAAPVAAPAVPGPVRSAVGTAWNAVRSLVPERVRHRLFPFFRGLYYRVFPGGRSGSE